MKRFQLYGLKSVALQTKFTAIAVNLKRITKLLSSPKADIFKNLQVTIVKFSNFLVFEIRNSLKTV